MINEMAVMTSTNTVVPEFANKNLRTATAKIYKIGETVRKCAYETAYIMAQVDETECYKDDGFNSVHDWTMQTFGFKKSASYTLLRVGKEYTRTLIGSNGKVKGYGSNLFGEDEIMGTGDFTTTQIEKMLPGGHELAVELVESGEITPDMTCKEIERVIKSYTKPETETEPEPETETESETETEPETEIEYAIVAVINNETGTFTQNGEFGTVLYKIPVDVLEMYRI